MAKSLPALGTVTDAAYTRLGAILVGANAAEKEADFVARTRDYWRRLVIDAEVRAAAETAAAEVEAAREAAATNPDAL